MRVSEAREVAADWVRSQAADPELVGAFLTGSAAVGPGEDELRATSDVDVILVVAGPAPAKIGKLWHRGVLLDVSGLAAADLDAAGIAGTSYLAPFLTVGTILYDPSGRLTRLRSEVAAIVDQPTWVRRRVAEVRTRITAGLDAADPAAALAEQVIGWVFPASLPAVLLLVAARRPPTVRTRYLRCRELLAAAGGARLRARTSGCDRAPLEVYEDLLEVLGCAHVSAGEVSGHLDSLAGTLRVTAEYARTTFPFSSDLRLDTWHVALGGSTDLVSRGWHREAVWRAGHVRPLPARAGG